MSHRQSPKRTRNKKATPQRSIASTIPNQNVSDVLLATSGIRDVSIVPMWSYLYLAQYVYGPLKWLVATASAHATCLQSNDRHLSRLQACDGTYDTSYAWSCEPLYLFTSYYYYTYLSNIFTHISFIIHHMW